MAKPLHRLMLIGLFFLFIMNVQAQEKCGTMAKHDHLMKTDMAYKQKFVQSEILAQKELALKGARIQGTVYKVPVVVHILHNGEALGVGPNITTDQVHSAITSLNDAYRKKAGTIYDGNGVDAEIEFCLAQKDPSGNPSTGINRVNAGLIVTSYASVGITDVGIDNEVAVKAISKWDNTKYYNIWVVSEIDDNGAGSGVQGYAYFAGASSTYDGTVILYNSFGYDPEGGRAYNLKSYTNKNITTIHELGHAFGLYHTFQGDGSGSTCPTNTNCTTQGDLVCDTPPHQRSSSNCLSGTNSCDGNSSRELFIHNFMDYSSDDCQTEFTAGQSTRARSILTSGRANLISSANLIACGCNSNTSPIARFYTNAKQPCEGVPVTFIDESINAPATYAWTFQGGTPATSSAQNPSVNFTGAGPYTVTLTVTSAASQNNTATKTAYISPVAGYSGTFPFTESFEGTFPPSGWQVISSDAPAVAWSTNGIKQWEKRTAAGSGAGTAAAAINIYNYNTGIGSKDHLVMPVLNLSPLNAASLTFKVAHKYYGAGSEDSLAVLISTNCGSTFTQLYKKGGAGLATGNSTTNFTPTVANDWRLETIDLSAYVGQVVQLRFRTTNDYGNNLYIDDVNILATYTPPVADFNASKTSNVLIAESITFTNASTSLSPISAYNWNFGLNASPATATGIGPHTVTYSTSGTKTISLVVTGVGGNDIESKTNYVNVVDATAAPVADFIASKTTGVQIAEVITYNDASIGNITSYTWDFGIGATPATATGAGPHSVSYTSGGVKTVSLSLVGTGGNDSEIKTNYVSVALASSVHSAESLGIKIYPNPTKDIVYIDLQDQEEVSVDVINTTSNQILKTVKGNAKIAVDLSGLPQGLYIFMVKTNKGNVVSRIAKAN